MPDLTTFLRARLDEDEQTASTAGPYDRDGGIEWAEVGAITEVLLIGADRVLAEVQAKRAILDLHTCTCPNPNCTDCDACSGQHHADPTPAPCETIKHLALPYADHPDYREEWRP